MQYNSFKVNLKIFSLEYFHGTDSTWLRLLRGVLGKFRGEPRTDPRFVQAVQSAPAGRKVARGDSPSLSLLFFVLTWPPPFFNFFDWLCFRGTEATWPP